MPDDAGNQKAWPSNYDSKFMDPKTLAGIERCLNNFYVDGNLSTRNNDSIYADSGIVAFNASWVYDDTGSKADPTEGKILFDNIDPVLATEMYIDTIDASGLDMTAWITGLSAGIHLRIGQVNGLLSTALFIIDDTPVDETGYFTIPLTNISSGTDALIDEAQYSFQFEGGGGAGGATPLTVGSKISDLTQEYNCSVFADGYSVASTGADKVRFPKVVTGQSKTVDSGMKISGTKYGVETYFTSWDVDVWQDG